MHRDFPLLHVRFYTYCEFLHDGATHTKALSRRLSYPRAAEDQEKKTGNSQPRPNVLGGTISDAGTMASLTLGWGFLMGEPEFIFKFAKKTLLRESVSHSLGENIYSVHI